jgi:hypothetical protein
MSGPAAATGQRGSGSGDLARGAGQPRVEAADAEDAIAVAEAADIGPRRHALTRRAEVGVDADQAGDADEQRPGGGRHLHLDVRRRLELDDAAQQAEVLRLDRLVHQHQDAVGELVEKGENGFLLARRADFGAEQRQQLDALRLAENQRVADHRIAADHQPGQQRVVGRPRG